MQVVKIHRVSSSIFLYKPIEICLQSYKYLVYKTSRLIYFIINFQKLTYIFIKPRYNNEVTEIIIFANMTNIIKNNSMNKKKTKQNF
jgi:hypothetical protein